MKIDVLFIVEHADREFQTIKMISDELHLQYGLRTSIKSLNFDYYQLIYIQPKVIVVPYMTNESEFPTKQIIKFFGNYSKILCMHWEQFLSKANKDYKRPNSRFIQEKVYHIAWQSFFKNYLVESGVNAKNIFITGKPSNSILFQKQKEADELRQQFSVDYGLDKSKNWLFLPMNYAWAFSNDNLIEAKVKNGYNREIGYAYREYARKCLRQFVKFIQEVEKAFTNLQIVIRPHPSISKSQYREVLDRNNIKYHNVKFISDHTIFEWIAASDIVGSSWSTSVYDARLVGKPVFLYTPYKRPDFLDVEWNGAVPNLLSVEQFKDFYEKSITKKPQDIPKLDNPLSKISEIITDLNHTHSTKATFKAFDFIDHYFILTLWRSLKFFLFGKATLSDDDMRDHIKCAQV